MQLEVPLFPLETVFYPGGELALQIFETRYIDLVRYCTRNDTCFAICLTLPGDDHQPAKHTKMGTAARICDWYTRENSLLGISVNGLNRISVQKTRVQDNGLIIAEVSWLKQESRVALPIEFSVLATIVARYIEKAGEKFPDFRPEQLEDAVFISYRLAELLPLRVEEKQNLLELDDVLERLRILQRALPRFQSA